MLSISTDENLTTTIIGEFWDFDRLYFAISKFTGDYGINTPCPFPGYETVCENLLGLNYELRHAMSGDRDITEHYSGIPEYWIAPEGQENRVRRRSSGDEQDDTNLTDGLNIEFFEDRILLNLPEEIEWETFEDMDEEEKMDLLIDLGFDYDDCELYLQAAEEAEKYLFSRKKVPHFTGYNSYLSLSLPLSEAIFYALILRELLPKTDDFKAHCRYLMDHNLNGLGSVHAEYYYTGMYLDLARMEEFARAVFHSLYRILQDDYRDFTEMLNKKTALFLQGDLAAMNALVVKYAHRVDGMSDKNTICQYLKELLK